MKRGFFLWFLAFVITLASAVYQRLTGPTYPLRGKVEFSGQEVRFRLPRSQETTSDCLIAIQIRDPQVVGRLLYQRFKTDDPWTEVLLIREGDRLVGNLPRQPAAGKLAYRVFLTSGDKDVSLSGKDPVIIRFKDPVPLPILLCHVVVMFAAMLFSTRAGIAALDKKGQPRRLVIWTAALLFVGGFILGPLVQKYAFGSWWTGFPFGFDLTDNKTLVAMIGWLAALAAGRSGRPARAWVLGASILTLVIFLIPHSLLGSELKYTDTGS